MKIFTFPRDGMNTLILRLILIAAFAGMAMMAHAQISVPFASVRTDKDDYPPGSTAIVYGYTFQPGEEVELHVEHADGDPLGIDPHYHQPWTVNADELGNFTTSWYVPIDGDALGARFKLSAHGHSSGAEVEWFFTDALSVSPNSITTCSGNAQFTISLTGNSAMTVWQVSSDNVNFTDLTNDAVYSGTTTTALTVNVTSFADGVYYFRAKGINTKSNIIEYSSSAKLTKGLSLAFNVLNAEVCYGASTNIQLDGTPNATVTYNINGGGAKTATLNNSGKINISSGPVTGPTNINFTNISLTGSNCSSALSSTAQVSLETIAPVFANIPTEITVASSLDQCGAAVTWTSPTATDNCSVTKNVLLIWDSMTPHTLALRDAMVNAGINVTLSQTPETGYNGTNPSLAGFDAVIHLNGTTVHVPMPAAGQSALVDFVVNKGKTYITNDWSSYEVDISGIMASMSSIVLFTYGNSFLFEPLVYNIIPAQSNNPILNSIPSSFTMPSAGFNRGGQRAYATNPSVALMTSVYGPTVLERNFSGGGKAVGFKHAGNYSGSNVLSDINAQRLFINSILYGNTPLTVTQTSGLPSGSVYPVGETNNTFVATDGVGNSTTVSFKVKVLDNQLPKFTSCPTDISVNGKSAAGAVVNYTAPVGSDNCPGAVTTLKQGLASSATFPLGETVVIYEVTDASGNKTQCSFKVNVTGVPPQIECPENITVNNDSGKCGASVAFAATDEVGIPSSDITYVIVDEQGIETPLTSGHLFAVGITKVKATATNPLGTSSCEFNVTVSDDEDPTISVLAASGNTSDNGTGDCTTTVDLGTPTTSDNCSVISLKAYVNEEEINPTTYLFGIGETEVSWVVTDGSDRTASVTQTVTVSDDEDPTISVIVASGNTSDNGTGDCTTTVDLGTPTTSDNCSVASVKAYVGEVEINPATYLFGIGETEVSWVVTDGSGRTASTTQTVAVSDDEDPTISALAASGNTSDNGTGDCTTTVDLGTPTTSDNCSVASVKAYVGEVEINPATYLFGIGETEVSWVVTDGSGRTASATQTVKVSDDELPVITSNGNKNVYTDAGVCGATVVVSASATDNCSVGAVSGVRSDGLALDALYPVGPTTITWNVTDANGNPAVEVEQIVVVNNDVPVITSISAPIDPVQVNTNVTLSVSYSDNDASNINVNWGDNTDSNHVPNSTITHAYIAAGVYTVTVRVDDWCGESDTEIYQYIVIFDPNGGFVTGGGWVKSPLGALVANPSLEGRANFGFVSKYKKGSTQVDGNTEFQFQTGSINFKSSGHIAGSLVITEFKAIYKGVGTINGLGNYGFMVSAVDGQITGGGGYDKFRIKIWDKNNGDALVYDNQYQTLDEYAALGDATKLQGGSIVIHTTKSGKRDGAPAEIAKEISDANLSVYPNPIEEVINVNYTSESEAPIGIQLFDLNGRSMKMQTFQANPSGEYQMPVSELNMNTGFYLLRIAQDQSTKTIKLLKK